MKNPLFNGSTRTGGQRSAALIVVLGVLVFLSLVVLSLTLALETERQSAHYYAARGSADLLAQEGIEYVRATLLAAEQPANSWVTAPGVIYYWPTNLTVGGAVPLALSSGPTNGASGIYAPPDLNRLVLSEDSLAAVTGTNVAEPMNVGWIYVHQSGLQDTSQTPAITTADPIIGRFAYWADDESSRINLNTAYATAGNTNSLNHPSRIDLTGLFGANYAQMIYTNALTSCFNSPDDARRLDPTLGMEISTNRFSVTHDAYSQNLNPWGRPKIILTTKQSVAGIGNTNFLDILTNQTVDPGGPTVSNDNSPCVIDPVKLGNQLNTINYYLTNAWPGYGGASFASKYGDDANGNAIASAHGGGVRTLQIAANIIDYVRSVESTGTICFPIRGAFTLGTTSWSNAGGTGGVGSQSTQVIFGNSRHPLVTELAAWQEASSSYTNPSTSQKEFRTYVEAELYLPPNYGLGSYTVATAAGGPDSMIVQSTGGSLVPATAVQITESPGTGVISPPWVGVGSATLNAGQFCVVSAEYVTGNNLQGTTIPVRVGFYDNGNQYEACPAYNATPFIQLPVNANDPSQMSGAVLEVNDPRVNKVYTTATSSSEVIDWTKKLGTTMGTAPQGWMTYNSAIVPPQDTDSSGNTISPASLFMPPPTGTTYTYNGTTYNNSAGVVQSLSELGYVDTGMECSTNVTSGVPWRTIRLQPTPAASRTLPPDWVLLDLFQAPYASTNRVDLYQPETNNGAAPVSMAGLVNINSSSTPFTNNLSVVRTAPLLALFQNATNMTPANAQTAAANVGAMNLAANGTNYGVPAFVSPGELAEVAGIADSGEASEANLRGVVDLSTVRGGTFRVFSVGQTLQQTPAGLLVVQSEQYKEAIIRQDSVTHHGTVFWKNISQ